MKLLFDVNGEVTQFEIIAGELFDHDHSEVQVDYKLKEVRILKFHEQITLAQKCFRFLTPFDYILKIHKINFLGSSYEDIESFRRARAWLLWHEGNFRADNLNVEVCFDKNKKTTNIIAYIPDNARVVNETREGKEEIQFQYFIKISNKQIIMYN